MVAALIEYIRSLSENNITVQVCNKIVKIFSSSCNCMYCVIVNAWTPTLFFQHYLYEMIINILVRNNCFYQLHQFLQYHVLQDSKPLVRISRIITHIEAKLEYCKRQLPLLKAEIVSKQCKTLYQSILGTDTPFYIKLTLLLVFSGIVSLCHKLHLPVPDSVL